MESKRVRVVIDIDPPILELLVQQGDIRIDKLGRVYGIGDYISRCAKRLGDGLP
jgi:hypothetical protein